MSYYFSVVISYVRRSGINVDSRSRPTRLHAAHSIARPPTGTPASNYQAGVYTCPLLSQSSGCSSDLALATAWPGRSQPVLLYHTRGPDRAVSHRTLRSTSRTDRTHPRLFGHERQI